MTRKTKKTRKGEHGYTKKKKRRGKKRNGGSVKEAKKKRRVKKWGRVRCGRMGEMEHPGMVWLY